MERAKLNRRQFIAAVGALGTLSVVGTGLGARPTLGIAADAEFPAPQVGKPIEAKIDRTTGDVEVNDDVIIRNTTCVGCYESCGNRIKVDRKTGRLLGVGGNPFHPSCSWPPLPFEASLMDEYRSLSFADGAGNETRGTLCGRGNGTLDAANQPTRITTPLKRAGKRGEGTWKPISWDQLITEVTEGGKLFAEIGEDQEIEGFKALHDNVTPIDPTQPDLGPKSNQIIIWNTRADGRRALNARFASAFGTLNAFSHNNS